MAPVSGGTDCLASNPAALSEGRWEEGRGGREEGKEGRGEGGERGEREKRKGRRRKGRKGKEERKGGRGREEETEGEYCKPKAS